ncbi:NAD(P)/FAD-dependent oxidoreductase [Vibrio sp. V03_P4A6T147]|uniref:NAD(P)/FAD-dependent oxidoreductase n=1 Tax=Vibrio sp. V03_P4A6T147 TaxID=1938658 RepID=UPI0026D2AA4E
MIDAKVTIIGGGFTGLSAAYELSKRGVSVVIIDSEAELGGLAASFDVAGEKLDRFYHHWFTNDLDVMNLIDELDLNSRVEISPTNTGVYYANSFFKLSTPWDLINFTPLSFFDRIKLGMLTLRARKISDWKTLENKTAHEWLKELGGDNVYRVIWEPLLKGKFGPYAESVSAVWFWNKLKLRGGSRGKKGEERLAYFKGGFVSLAEALGTKVKDNGGKIYLGTKATAVNRHNNNWVVDTESGQIVSERVIFTTSLPIISELIKDWAHADYLSRLNQIKYIGNVCLVLELDRSLSSTYWLNVNDPTFPFVGVIEHTNFSKPENYGGRHIVYLSKYLPHTDRLYTMNSDEFFQYSFPFLKEMFPDFDRSWVIKHHLWRARWSQPVVEKHYSKLIPEQEGPVEGMHICSMAQIYPEDRGTNYAIREGRSIGREVSKQLEQQIE